MLCVQFVFLTYIVSLIFFSLYTVADCNIQTGNSPLEFEKEAESLHQDKKEGPDLLDKDDDASDRQHDIVDDHSGKSRWSFQSLITPQLKSYLYSSPIRNLI